MTRLPTPRLGTADHLTVERLASACRTKRTTEVLRTVEDDPVVRQIRIGDQDARDRAAYLGGLVVAEVALARLRARAA